MLPFFCHLVTFELAAPTQQTSRAMSTATGGGRPSVNQQYLQQLLAILEKLDSLSDAVSGTVVRLLLRLDTLEGTVAALKKDIEKYALAEGTLVPCPTPMPYFPGIKGLSSEFYSSPPSPPPPPRQD